jgi:hypothetical protein
LGNQFDTEDEERVPEKELRRRKAPRSARGSWSKSFHDMLYQETPTQPEVPMLKIAHQRIRSRNVLCGTTVFSFNELGIAEVPGFGPAPADLQVLLKKPGYFIPGEPSEPSFAPIEAEAPIEEVVSEDENPEEIVAEDASEDEEPEEAAVEEASEDSSEEVVSEDEKPEETAIKDISEGEPVKDPPKSEVEAPKPRKRPLRKKVGKKTSVGK